MNEISPVCGLKFTHCYFSFYYFFLFIVVKFVLELSVTLWAVVISPFLFCLMKTSTPRINASMQSLTLVSPRLPSFLDTNRLCHILDKLPCLSSSNFLTSGLFVWVILLFMCRIIPRILLKLSPWCLFLWWDFCLKASFWEDFLFVLFAMVIYFRIILLSLRMLWSLYWKSPVPLVRMWHLYCSTR